MNVFHRPSLVVALDALERFAPWKAPVRMIGWFRHHLYSHCGVPVEGDNLSFVLRENPGPKIEVIDGVRVDSSALTAPRLGCVKHGTRIFTHATVERDELIFQYAPGVLADFPCAGGSFAAAAPILGLQQEILETLDRLPEPGVADRIDLLALQLIAETRRVLAATDSATRVDARIYRIAARMATECGRPGGVAEFIREFGWSRGAFYRAWRQYSAVPPAEVLRENRLRLAARLLTTSVLTVKEIAFRCGFRDGVGLAQAFTARYGVPPREYAARSPAADSRSRVREL